MRIRVPEQWWGDYLAALGAARIGEREIMTFGNEIGWDTLTQFAEQWFDYSEQLMIAAVRKMPGGRTETTSMHDPFPNAEDGIPVKIVVEVDPEEAMIDIDLRDNPDAMPCGLNLSRACCESTLLLGVFNSIPTRCRPTPAPSAACACTCARTASAAFPGTRRAARWRRPISPTAWATR